MKKIYLNSNKGVTIVALIVTIILLLILSGVTINNLNKSNDVTPYNNMVSDVDLLENEILLYYNKYNEIPKTDREIIIHGKKCYEIDLSKLDNLVLNYGRDYGKNNELVVDQSDVYVVNDSIEVYYVKGVGNEGEKHYNNEEGKNSNITSTDKTPNDNVQQINPKLADVITPDNYGDVIEYEANGVKDWKIFFNDGNNVFIITSKYIPDTCMPENSKMISKNTYNITWEPVYGAPSPGFEGHAPIVNNITENSKILERAEKFKLEWIQKNVDNNLNKAIVVKDLLNSEVWNVFAEGLEGAEAIGTPTLELLSASWKQKGYKEIVYKCNEEGYYIGEGGSWIGLTAGNEYQDPLYFPYQLNHSVEDKEWVNSTGCGAYWLAAASTTDNHGLLCVSGEGGMFPDWYSAFYLGLRPVVCLPNNAIAKNENGIWTSLALN